MCSPSRSATTTAVCSHCSGQRLASLRAEADAAVARAETAEAKVKELEQQILSKDQEITSLNHKLTLAEEESEKYEAKLTEMKAQAQDSESSKSTNDALQRKVQLLEEELDAAEKHSKEVVEKCVLACDASRSPRWLMTRCNIMQAATGRCQGGGVRATRTETGAGARSVGEEVRGVCPSLSPTDKGADAPVASRKCKRSTASPSPSWTSSCRTWRVSNLWMSDNNRYNPHNNATGRSLRYNIGIRVSLSPV